MIIATFNIAHGRGLARRSWLGGGRNERRKRLYDIAEVLAPADVAVLNEVDFSVWWSFGVNQAQEIMRHAGF
jgi:hypothetical protein